MRLVNAGVCCLLGTLFLLLVRDNTQASIWFVGSIILSNMKD